MRKQGGKPEALMDKKPAKLDKELRKKTNYLLLCIGWKTSET